VIGGVAIRTRYEAVAGHLDERGFRLFTASEARATGRGGIAAVSQITGIARNTIGRGLKDPEPDAQFQRLNDEVVRFGRTGQPAISVDTKKKERVGDFKDAYRSAATCTSKAGRAKCACTTSSSPAKAAPCPTASTTLPPTRARTASASITIPPPSPPRASAAGSGGWGARDTRRTPPAHHRRLRRQHGSTGSQ